jgi:hypothetical protein
MWKKIAPYLTLAALAVVAYRIWLLFRISSMRNKHEKDIAEIKAAIKAADISVGASQSMLTAALRKQDEEIMDLELRAKAAMEAKSWADLNKLAGISR